ncbi:S-adenosyl-L-methionine-dependent methyltransferase [Pyrenochaeta sp. MPI-SDFR-AT-0127]|nr:S-adenosyl-L-methionine-dependent methyltransferase [Pyrenochaeta sp. MPI-SDFR-AT-0127]
MTNLAQIGAVEPKRSGEKGTTSTQNTQYDQIGTKYNFVHELPSVEPERPSVIKALGNIRGKRCMDLACGTGRYTALLSSLGAASVHGYDISSAMVDGAMAAYPSSTHSSLRFRVADCSIPGAIQHDIKFDIVFAGWFLDYAGTERELTNMFKVIVENLSQDGRFVGITTNTHDTRMADTRIEFYGIDVLVLDPNYVAPDTGSEVGVVAKVRARTEPVVEFEVFQFRKEVYQRCAEAAGMRLSWGDVVLPHDERVENGYWNAFIERPTFTIVTGVVV